MERKDEGQNSRPGGYLLLARRMLDSEIFANKPPIWFKIWVYILLKVNYCDGGWLKRGQGYFSWHREKPLLKGSTRNQWVRCVRWLKQAQQIATLKTPHGIVITVLNYDRYQDSLAYTSTTQSTTESTTRAQHAHNRSDAIPKGSKEVKEINEVMSPVKVKMQPQQQPETTLTKKQQWDVAASSQLHSTPKVRPWAPDEKPGDYKKAFQQAKLSAAEQLTTAKASDPKLPDKPVSQETVKEVEEQLERIRKKRVDKRRAHVVVSKTDKPMPF